MKSRIKTKKGEKCKLVITPTQVLLCNSVCNKTPKNSTKMSKNGAESKSNPVFKREINIHKK